jgi:hypothetical protein
MSHWVCHAWSKTLLTSPMAPTMNTLTSSRGKPITFPFVSEISQLLFSDNCAIGLYCDTAQKVCTQRRAIGTQCDADKE